MFLFVRCFIHSCLALSQALHLLRRSSLTSVVLDVLVIHAHSIRGLRALSTLNAHGRQYVPAAHRLSASPNYFMGVVSGCPFSSFALKGRIGSISFVRCPESRSVRFLEVGFVLKL